MAATKRTRSRSHRTILSEDAYVSALEHIIERDYYPSTAALHADLARLGHGRVPAQPTSKQNSTSTRRGTAGAGAASAADQGQSQVLPNDLERLSLNDFFSAYTSEDNASFESLLADDTESRRKRHHWTHPLMIKDHEEGKSPASASQSTEKYREGMLMLYYLKEGTILTAAERQDMDMVLASGSVAREKPRSAERYGILTKPQNFQVRNAMFFPPEGILDDSHGASQKGSARRSGSMASDGRVATHNTRLPDEPAGEGEGMRFAPEGPHSPTVYSGSMSRSESSRCKDGEKYPILDMSPPRTPRFEMQPPSRRDQLARSLADSASINSKHSSKRRRVGSQTTAALASSARSNDAVFPRSRFAPSASSSSRDNSFAASLQRTYSRK